MFLLLTAVQHERGPRKPKLHHQKESTGSHIPDQAAATVPPIKMTSAPMFPPPPGIKSSTEGTPHPLFLAHQPPPPGLLQILMSAEKCQVHLKKNFTSKNNLIVLLISLNSKSINICRYCFIITNYNRLLFYVGLRVLISKSVFISIS